jgi:CNT family concentrative nucleoside transporter
MERFIGILGLACIVGLGVAFSTNRRAIRWPLVAWGLGLQLALAVFILRIPAGQWLFQKLGDLVTALLDFTKVGAGFVFGKLVDDIPSMGFIFAFQVLPTIIFVGSLMGVAYYLGIMQRVISAVAKVMVKTMGTSGAESLYAVGTVFVGQSEAPLLVRPYIATMTHSELMAIMTAGMATIAGSVMAAYIGMGIPASHLLAASIMGAPAGLVMAKLLVPETEEPLTKGLVRIDLERSEANVIEAAAKGAIDGMHLAFIVGGMLISFIAIVAMINAGLALVGTSMETLLGYVFAPLAFVMGVPAEDVLTFGGLLGKKIVLNEFVAYSELTEIIKGNTTTQLGPRATTMATYALCGFANFASIAINIGCLSGIAPERRGEVASLGLRAMAAGALASCLTATIAGFLLS